jgi:hypothetical protein
MLTAELTASREATGVDVVVHQTSPGAIIDLLQLAIEHKLPVETLERLQALHERVSDRAAAIEFARELAAFQEECPPIAKTSTASIVSKGGARYSYTFASLDQIARTVRPLLATRGFSYAWDSEVRDKALHCVCILRHVNGHSERANFSAPVESSAGMSEQQKHASALTYARRQSLVQVLGLTTTEPDTDAANPEPISQGQADDLRALIEEAGANLTRFLRWAKVERLEDLQARDYESAVNAVRAVGEKKRAGQ